MDCLCLRQSSQVCPTHIQVPTNPSLQGADKFGCVHFHFPDCSRYVTTCFYHLVMLLNYSVVSLNLNNIKSKNGSKYVLYVYKMYKILHMCILYCTVKWGRPECVCEGGWRDCNVVFNSLMACGKNLWWNLSRTGRGGWRCLCWCCESWSGSVQDQIVVIYTFRGWFSYQSGILLFIPDWPC